MKEEDKVIRHIQEQRNFTTRDEMLANIKLSVKEFAEDLLKLENPSMIAVICVNAKPGDLDEFGQPNSVLSIHTAGNRSDILRALKDAYQHAREDALDELIEDGLKALDGQLSPELLATVKRAAAKARADILGKGTPDMPAFLVRNPGDKPN